MSKSGLPAGGASSLSLSPAYAFADGLEIAALLARDSTNDIAGSAVQLKWLFTPSQDKGCNFGASLGAARTRGLGVTLPGVLRRPAATRPVSQRPGSVRLASSGAIGR